MIPNPLKIIFLDFDGVMATAYYNLLMVKSRQAETDEFGVLFDPICVQNLAKIVVSSDWKNLMSYEELLRIWETRNFLAQHVVLYHVNLVDFVIGHFCV